MNREQRRAAGTVHLPHDFVVISYLPGAVFVGLQGGGRARLSPNQARQLATELLELADSAQGALP